jgi:methylmalonyl-CoA epimerase
MLQKINHIGIAVHNLNEAIALYEKLGFQLEGIDEVPEQKVRVAFLPIGEVRIELLEPTSEDSPIAKFLEKKGQGIHHIAFATDNINEEMARMVENELNLIDMKPRPGAHGTQIAFLHPKSTMGVLMELCEEKK